MADPRLKAKLAEKKFFVVPGVQDMVAAAMVDRLGFEVVYGTGYWLTASAHGLPDAGIVGYAEMRDRMATLARSSKAAVIADADTGYGGLLNVHHTTLGYEAAGISAMQIEDQEFPKKCGHTPYKRVISCHDMAEKVRVAVDTRQEMLIIARTDARQSEGIDGVLRRLDAFANAGADVLFPEALESEEEMRKVCETFQLPIVINMANGGSTPILKADVLADIGFGFAIYPSLAALAGLSAMEKALTRLRDHGDGEPADVDLFDFKTFSSMIGFDGVRAFDSKWGQDKM